MGGHRFRSGATRGTPSSCGRLGAVCVSSRGTRRRSWYATAMLDLALLDIVIATLMALWLRALLRARGEDIPCTGRGLAWGLVAVAVVASVGLVVVNVLALKSLDQALGKTLSPLLFTVWLLAMSACAILFIIALTARHTNRTAAAWIRLVAPAQLVVRTAGEASTLRLEPGSVRL